MRPESLCHAIIKGLAGLLAITLFIPLEARAQGAVELRTYLTSVSRLYEDLEHERALEQIASARRLTRGAEDDVALGLYEGIILADLGRNEVASAAFKAALLLRPDARLPVQVAPKVEHLFEGLRQQVKQELAVLAKREAERQPPEARESRAVVAPPARPQRRELTPRQEGRVQVTGVSRPPLAPPAVSGSGSGGLRSHALIPAFAGGVLIAAGGASWSMAKVEQSRLRSGDPALASHAEVQRSMKHGRTFQTVGLSLVGGGLAGLGLAAGFYVFGAPKAPIKLGAGTDGTSAFVWGRWP